MPKTARYDEQALLVLLRKQHGVMAREQALACGVSLPTLSYRGRAGGSWPAILPGVYLTHTEPAAVDQREMAALLYAGPHSVLTGAAALRRFGLGPRTSVVDVLVPAGTQKRDAGFVRICRTTRLPETVGVAGEVRYAFPPRAVADAARGLADLGDVRAVVAGAVQRGKCPIGALSYELDTGPRRGPALLRRALAEVADGARSAAEADLRAMIRRARLPMPMFNARLFAGRSSSPRRTAGGRMRGSPRRWTPVSGTFHRATGRRLWPGTRGCPRTGSSRSTSLHGKFRQNGTR
jgi:hypothetical protein